MTDIKLINCSEKIGVHTRREIIEIWQGSRDEILNKLCCPNCRDLLFNFSSKDEYYCGNPGCGYYYGGEL